MAHSVDAGVQAMQAPDREPVLDRILPQPELQELNARDHSVLPTRQRSDRLVVPWRLIASLFRSVYIAG